MNTTTNTAYLARDGLILAIANAVRGNSELALSYLAEAATSPDIEQVLSELNTSSEVEFASVLAEEARTDNADGTQSEYPRMPEGWDHSSSAGATTEEILKGNSLDNYPGTKVSYLDDGQLQGVSENFINPTEASVDNSIGIEEDASVLSDIPQNEVLADVVDAVIADYNPHLDPEHTMDDVAMQGNRVNALSAVDGFEDLAKRTPPHDFTKIDAVAALDDDDGDGDIGLDDEHFAEDEDPLAYADIESRNAFFDFMDDDEEDLEDDEDMGDEDLDDEDDDLDNDGTEVSSAETSGGLVTAVLNDLNHSPQYPQRLPSEFPAATFEEDEEDDATAVSTQIAAEDYPAAMTDRVEQSDTDSGTGDDVHDVSGPIVSGLKPMRNWMEHAAVAVPDYHFEAAGGCAAIRNNLLDQRREAKRTGDTDRALALEFMIDRASTWEKLHTGLAERLLQSKAVVVKPSRDQILANLKSLG